MESPTGATNPVITEDSFALRSHKEESWEKQLFWGSLVPASPLQMQRVSFANSVMALDGIGCLL